MLQGHSTGVQGEGRSGVCREGGCYRGTAQGRALRGVQGRWVLQEHSTGAGKGVGTGVFTEGGRDRGAQHWQGHRGKGSMDVQGSGKAGIGVRAMRQGQRGPLLYVSWRGSWENPSTWDAAVHSTLGPCFTAAVLLRSTPTPIAPPHLAVPCPSAAPPPFPHCPHRCKTSCSSSSRVPPRTSQRLA